jgi:hypothetical protein
LHIGLLAGIAFGSKISFRGWRIVVAEINLGKRIPGLARRTLSLPLPVLGATICANKYYLGFCHLS